MITQCAALAKKHQVLSAPARACLADKAASGEAESNGWPKSHNTTGRARLEPARQALAARPGDLAGIARLAYAYLTAGELQRARLVLDHALEKRSTAKLLNLRGVISAQLAEPQRALAFFDRALKENPLSQHARANKAALLAAFGLIAAARAEAGRLPATFDARSGSLLSGAGNAIKALRAR